jgi:hypothetical protein
VCAPSRSGISSDCLALVSLRRAQSLLVVCGAPFLLRLKPPAANGVTAVRGVVVMALVAFASAVCSQSIAVSMWVTAHTISGPPWSQPIRYVPRANRRGHGWLAATGGADASGRLAVKPGHRLIGFHHRGSRPKKVPTAPLGAASGAAAMDRAPQIVACRGRSRVTQSPKLQDCSGIANVG